VRVNKAWKAEGEDGATDIPRWLVKLLKPKHKIRGHYLGNPKTPKSRRTITVPPTVVELLEIAHGGQVRRRLRLHHPHRTGDPQR
jgi:hypothetical protein